MRKTMNTLLLTLSLSLFLRSPKAIARPVQDPSTVLILVNDAYLPETGTGAQGASDFVGEHYAVMRNIPPNNIVHLNIPYAGYQSDGK